LDKIGAPPSDGVDSGATAEACARTDAISTSSRRIWCRMYIPTETRTMTPPMITATNSVEIPFSELLEVVTGVAKSEGTVGANVVRTATRCVGNRVGGNDGVLVDGGGVGRPEGATVTEVGYRDGGGEGGGVGRRVGPGVVGDEVVVGADVVGRAVVGCTLVGTRVVGTAVLGVADGALVGGRLVGAVGATGISPQLPHSKHVPAAVQVSFATSMSDAQNRALSGCVYDVQSPNPALNVVRCPLHSKVGAGVGCPAGYVGDSVGTPDSGNRLGWSVGPNVG
jgi:hypothetical protein